MKKIFFYKTISGNFSLIPTNFDDLKNELETNEHIYILHNDDLISSIRNMFNETIEMHETTTSISLLDKRVFLLFENEIFFMKLIN